MKGEKKVEEVTCLYSRLFYYYIALTVSLQILLETEPPSWMPVYVYATLRAANIPYIGMVIWCLSKDVPVPRYRLWPEGRVLFFLSVMIFMYCISYNVKDVMNRVEASIFGWCLILAGIAIVQLSCPVEDFTVSTHTLSTMYLGALFAILGGIGRTSSLPGDFIGTLLCFPITLFIICLLDPLDDN
ncbi:uncharacterized protein LOC110230527 [Arabidopsis lyrata subsp. lyrata]|uniref:uncharacterized protein LOC110230527 n=1 Tax=Arabidopsis lyrata subsp. lyrata TaxID=81972 RepID=UPI000A29A40B|nr:uncharacterized protein LOC110230527 [Arabidopsis lyrata subsp. lyrata]|eukprot:XP_020889486.1 uncharacterized protein LOC110230527 [Arabidopsis lyrata subsp. lyrata]